MLKREFRRSESVAILILTIIILALVYYQFVYRGIEAAKQRYSTAELENQIMIEQAKAVQIENMRAEIEDNKDNDSGVIVTYDNLKAEINELNDIFSDADTFSFGFDQAVGTGDAVRRKINASFTASSYEKAKEMLQKLHDSKYRCLIQDISVAATQQSGTVANGDEANLNKGPVAVNFSVTFYETLYQATTTDGLLIEVPMEDVSSATEDELIY